MTVLFFCASISREEAIIEYVGMCEYRGWVGVWGWVWWWGVGWGVGWGGIGVDKYIVLK